MRSVAVFRCFVRNTASIDRSFIGIINKLLIICLTISDGTDIIKKNVRRWNRMAQILDMVQKILLYFKEFDAAAVIAIIKNFFETFAAFAK